MHIDQLHVCILMHLAEKLNTVVVKQNSGIAALQVMPTKQIQTLHKHLIFVQWGIIIFALLLSGICYGVVFCMFFFKFPQYKLNLKYINSTIFLLKSKNFHVHDCEKKLTQIYSFLVNVSLHNLVRFLAMTRNLILGNICKTDKKWHWCCFIII